MHLENDLDYRLIVLNHAPNLRTFLHRYDLYETKYWSVFDEIQGFVTMRHKRLIIIT
ncbi:accessory Sec system glycosyltransferase Asp1 [Staphylococcus aureus]|nr:accessory Sec system glycosyltransferase Asp1 [Staphylococcus aureus]